MAAPLVELVSVCAGYGAADVLKDVGLCVQPREAWAVLGPNGAGKSSLARVLLGLLPARSGTVHVCGLPLPQTPASAEPFPVWHKVAHALAEDMDADLLDDAGRPITLHAFDAIGKELAQLYAALESHDLAAGTPAARRLFAG